MIKLLEGFLLLCALGYLFMGVKQDMHLVAKPMDMYSLAQKALFGPQNVNIHTVRLSEQLE